MGGGTWTSQNKVLPGSYINLQTNNALTINPAARGIGTLALPMSWGPEGEVITIQNGQYADLPLVQTDLTTIEWYFLGTSQTPPPLTLLLWRLATTGGAEPTVTVTGLTATGLYNGARTDLSFGVANDPDNSGMFVVTTYAGGLVIDVKNNISTIAELITADNGVNPVLVWSGSGSLVVTAVTSLAGGSNGTIASGAFAAYLAAIQTYTFDNIGYPGTESYTPLAVTSVTSSSTTATVTTAAPHGWTTSSVISGVVIAGASPTAYNGTYTITATGASTFTYTFAGSGTSPATGTITYDPTAYIVGQNQSVMIGYINSWVNNQGKYVSGVLGGIIKTVNSVLADTTAQLADSPWVVSINNGVILGDGTVLSAAQCVPWFTGASAGANYNQSLTYANFPGAVDCNPRLTNTLLIQYTQQGSLCFEPATATTVHVVTDINTYTTFIPTKGQVFSKNRPIRTMQQWSNDCQNIFSTQFAGKVDNNGDGDNLYQLALVVEANDLQTNRAIKNFDPSDIVITPGSAGDSVVVTANLQTVDAIEKSYMTVTVS